MTGKKTWWFPDGDLPEPVSGDDFVSHESLMVLNPNPEPATISLVLYWEDKRKSSGMMAMNEAFQTMDADFDPTVL